MILLLLACIPPCERVRDDHGVTWVGFCGGPFEMGSDHGAEEQRPRHTVTVPPFAMARTETTVGQFAACVDEGACPSAPESSDPLPELCSWGRGDNLPMTCANQEMARSFCDWAEARLPSEAEWEFAARGQGTGQLYPWGNETPTCELAAIPGEDCMPEGVLPVCSKSGHTQQGLCDMAGNAFEWVEDTYNMGYEGTPVDGSPDTRPSNFSSMRGGGYNSVAKLTTRTRTFHPPDFFYSGMGFRCARDGQ